jgi:hypothetical protein
MALYQGEVVCFYAFDTAFELNLDKIQSALGRPVTPYTIESLRKDSRDYLFHLPKKAVLSENERDGPCGKARVTCSVKFFAIGALSISFRFPFAVEHTGQLAAFFNPKLDGQPLNAEARRLATELHRELLPYSVRPVPQLPEEETYTVFCFRSPLPEGLAAETWLKNNKKEAARLLTLEKEFDSLSAQEVDDAAGRFVSYYKNDLAVVERNAAIVVDEPRSSDQALYVLELANLQLSEIESYDRVLDNVLDQAYRDLRGTSWRRRGEVLRALREIRIDLACFSDEMRDLTRFFNDWHLAQVHALAADRLHLNERRRAIDEKLDTLDDLYRMFQHDNMNFWMLFLEAAIVFLFITDIIMLLWPKQ